MAVGISLRDLAGRTHYSRGHLSKVETGQKRPTAELARLCDAALDAGGELVRLATPARRTDLALGDAGEVWMMGLDSAGGGWFVPVTRREILLAAGASSISGLAVEAPEHVGEPYAALGAATFRSWFDQIRQYGQRVAPGVLLPTLIAQTATLRGMAGAAPPKARPGLLTLAARFAEYTGWMAQEAGDDRAALWWTSHAVELGEAGGDPAMRSYALVRRALITLYREDPDQTVELARQAQAEAVPARVRGLAAVREAQGLALVGDHARCHRALERARTLLSADPLGHDDALPALGTSTLADPVSTVTGWCLYDLGRPGEAGAILDREIARIPAEAQRSGLRYAVRRALAYAALGEVEHACELTVPLLAPLREIHSATVRQDCRRLARTLARWRGHPRVRELLPELTSTLRTPTTTGG